MWNRARTTVLRAFCRPHHPKVVRTRQFFTIFVWNRALATVSCTFCRPHLQKVQSARQVFTISMWNPALNTASCTFCRPHLEKWAEPSSFLGLSVTYKQGPDSKGLDSRGLAFKAFRIDNPFLKRAKQILAINRQTLKLDREILSRTTFFQGTGRNATEIKPKVCLFCPPSVRGYCIHGDVLGVMFREGDMSAGAPLFVF